MHYWPLLDVENLEMVDEGCFWASAMVISHKNKFIFIHCRKVAGSSIKVALSRFLGPWDIQIGCHPDCYEYGIHPNLRFYWDLAHWDCVKPIAKRLARSCEDKGKSLAIIGNAAQKRAYEGRLGPNPTHPHASSIKKAFPKEWAEYFKFAFVRNPYDRAVSDFLYRRRLTGSNADFLTYLEILSGAVEDRLGLKPQNWDNWPMYTIDDMGAVDVVGRYEQLDEEIEDVGQKIGLDLLHVWPKCKLGRHAATYREWYGEREKAIATRLFWKEIDHFKYRF